ncbi:hypothetical protein C7438_1217 [Brockia lithotrophica]|uniref:Uncharacterized protein n=1 Tax=Brockia lithotrophica TaxID=933949 RepID=A0A660KUR2_9BACL|nr:hypothetical protein C7438_1217 [Brockia lithotrophica]
MGSLPIFARKMVYCRYQGSRIEELGGETTAAK